MESFDKKQYRGCLLGLVAGDALGAPVEQYTGSLRARITVKMAYLLNGRIKFSNMIPLFLLRMCSTRLRKRKDPHRAGLLWVFDFGD